MTTLLRKKMTTPDMPKLDMPADGGTSKSRRKSYMDWHTAYMEEMGYKDAEEEVDKQSEDKDTI